MRNGIFRSTLIVGKATVAYGDFMKEGTGVDVEVRTSIDAKFSVPKGGEFKLDKLVLKAYAHLTVPGDQGAGSPTLDLKAEDVTLMLPCPTPGEPPVALPEWKADPVLPPPPAIEASVPEVAKAAEAVKVGSTGCFHFWSCDDA